MVVSAHSISVVIVKGRPFNKTKKRGSVSCVCASSARAPLAGHSNK